ncbi:polysaccharide lyase family 1 protein [Micromonospora chaiyaphumensis]|uniref:Pectate lyase n=1 Tax=Micromonospora chaiyaphumensis TaxID=307119 RepID=A0A1C4UJE5_9ACTN|nr:pectate lyase [Micromonospora chaiyaphumensis]SCE71788.1 pectate lyase [Micromonospora chaiyaphumensis]
MRRTAVGAALLTAALAVTGAPAPAAPAGPALSRPARDLGRQALPANDGWAAEGAGTTGGAAAAPDRIRVVRTRAELVEALGGDNAANAADATPKIVYVAGTVDGFEGPDGTPLDCADLADPDYTLDGYLAAYDPAVWGRVDPSGPLEAARVRSAANQTRQTQINVGANTTIVGLRGARLTGLTLMIDRVDNVIVRNLTLADARDCFPAWSPTDGDAGNWNSQYDQISVRRSEHVWVDHNTFTDGDNPDGGQPTYFGRPYQVHDGSLDVTHTASLVTASWNRFAGRDKLMLIGSSNTVGPDVDRLKVSVHHNLFDGDLQRLPRVRFGQVDVHENHYRLGGPRFEYALGVGVRSAIVAENNFFTLAGDVDPADLIHDWGGTALTERGSWLRQGGGPAHPVDLLGAYNAAHDPDLGGDAGWRPTLRAAPVLPTPLVPLVVGAYAGAGRLPL